MYNSPWRVCIITDMYNSPWPVLYFSCRNTVRESRKSLRPLLELGWGWGWGWRGFIS